jgi:orotate phosphoribosyltransferase-like protein
MERVMATAKKEKAEERWKLTMQLRFSGKTYKEIGRVLGVSTAMARNIFMRAQREEGNRRKEKLFIDWRVSYDYTILVPIIDQIRGLAKDERQG